MIYCKVRYRTLNRESVCMSWSRSSGGFETERLYGKVETEEGDQGILVRYFRVVDTLGTISDRTVRWVLATRITARLMMWVFGLNKFN